MAKIIVLAETGADIPAELAERYEIKIVPMHVSFRDETLDDGAFPVQKVYEYHSTTRQIPKTSASTPEDFRKAFDEIHERHPGCQIFYMAYSAITTCSYENGQMEAGPDDRVTFFDTKFVSAGQGVIVLRVARLLSENPDMTMEAVILAAEEARRRARMAFFPGDLAYLRAGGRVSNAGYIGAQILGLQPLIEILEGKLLSTKKYRGSMAKVAVKLYKEYTESQRLSKDELVFLYSIGLDEEIMRDIEARAKADGFRNIRWNQTGCVISTHSGPGAFGLAGFAEE